MRREYNIVHPQQSIRRARRLLIQHIQPCSGDPSFLRRRLSLLTFWSVVEHGSQNALSQAHPGSQLKVTPAQRITVPSCRVILTSTVWPARTSAARREKPGEITAGTSPCQ